MKNFKKLVAIFMTATLVLGTIYLVTATSESDAEENDYSTYELETMENGHDVENDFEFNENLHGPNRVFESFTGKFIREGYNAGSSQQYIVIESEYGGEIWFNIDRLTFMPERFPQEGDIVRAFYDFNAIITMIYPPQYSAVAVMVVDEDSPTSFFLGRFNEEKISMDGTLHLVIGEDTEFRVQDDTGFGMFQEEFLLENEDIFNEFGRLIFVEYDFSHRNINPTTVFPTRISILLERAVHPIFDFGFDIDLDSSNDLGIVDLENGTSSDFDALIFHFHPEGSILIDGELVPNVMAQIVGDGYFLNYVPVRGVVEFLGGTVSWRRATGDVVVSSPLGEVVLEFGSNVYTATAANGAISNMTLNEPPVLVDGVTLVPISFFRVIFGFNNAYSMHGNVFIYNGEVME